MKKQTALFWSFSAVLAVGALAPHYFWNKDHSNRFPASVEEKVEIKKEDKKEEKKDEQKEMAISCLKDKQPAALEAEIKKLMADKESILKEIADLKKAKEEPKKEDDKEETKKDAPKKEVAKASDPVDVLSLMSQMTSLMMSQQQQQMMLMNQMFSMMQNQNNQWRPFSSYNSQLADYMYPYAMDMSSFHQNYNMMPFHSYDMFANNNIGLGYQQEFGHQQSFREPSQESSQQLQRAYFEPQKFMQTQQPIPVDGFNFGQGEMSSSGMQRVQF